MRGKVVIVGAGPGPADLLTMRATAMLRAAQVVLHDDLVSAEVLALRPRSALTINVGKRCGERARTQEQINGLMAQHARKGCLVVRLKSGDPSVFGRLGEELEALREAGIPFEVVPGVTAAAAAASAAGITLTDRRLASALVVLTAHHAGGDMKAQSLFDPQRTTFAIYMPGPDYGSTAHDLMQQGIAADTPCAVVSNACRDNQEVRVLPLARLGSAHCIAAPALLIVGRVAAAVEDSLLKREDTEQVWSPLLREAVEGGVPEVQVS